MHDYAKSRSICFQTFSREKSFQAHKFQEEFCRCLAYLSPLARNLATYANFISK